jgi:hypothetical protein
LANDQCQKAIKERSILDRKRSEMGGEQKIQKIFFAKNVSRTFSENINGKKSVSSRFFFKHLI